MSQEEKQYPQIAARERGPGPGRYRLPPVVGYNEHCLTRRRRPAYTMLQRNFRKYTNDCSPGPSYFIDPKISRCGLDGTPEYSLAGRTKDSSTFKTPAPGAYSPEKVHPQGERHAPSYSMAARTRYRKSDSNPAPSKYSLPSGPKLPNKRSAAAYSMTGRNKVGGFSEDLGKTPGPGKYAYIDPDVYQRRMPQYSMQGRNLMPGDSTTKPGPGAHSPESVYVHKRKPPSFSMGIRHSEFITPLIVDVHD